MRTGKILGYIVGGVLALIGVVLAAVWLLVNPNDYKPRIAAAVKQATGRDLVLTGDIKLSVFPWIALQLGPASLGNPPGFGAQPFVSFQKAAVRVKVLPLLAKRLEIGRVELDGLDLRLLRNAQGQGNWEGFGKAQPDTPAAPADDQGGGAMLQGIAGVKVTHARLSYDQYTLDNVSLETGAFAENGRVPVTLHVEASRGVPTEHAVLDAKLEFAGDLAAKRYHLAALNLNGSVNLAHNERPVRWEFVTPVLDVDLAAQILTAPAFTLNLAGAQLTGGLRGTALLDAMHLNGSVALAPLIVREFLPRLGLSVPATRDPKALSSVSFSSAFQYGGNAARLNELSVIVDDTHMKGSAALTNLATQAIEFNLAVDGIDMDRYLAPTPAGTPATPPPPAPAPAANGGPKSAPLNAHGTLTLGRLKLAPLELTQVKVTLAAQDGVLHVHPLEAQVYGGQYSGDVTLDSRESVPILSLDEHLSGIDVARLVSTGAKKIHVVGRGNVTLKATGRGAAADPLLKTLNGHLDANVANGAVEGVDLGYEIGQAEALLKRQSLPGGRSTGRTAFDALKFSAQISNGVAQTHDLTISSAVLKVTGQGTVALPTQALDLSLVVDTLRTAGNVPLQIPVKITGTAASPTVRPDVEALAKGQLKQKVQDVLQDKLKGLFNR